VPDNLITRTSVQLDEGAHPRHAIRQDSVDMGGGGFFVKNDTLRDGNLLGSLNIRVVSAQKVSEHLRGAREIRAFRHPGCDAAGPWTFAATCWALRRRAKRVPSLRTPQRHRLSPKAPRLRSWGVRGLAVSGAVR
jgi:hypothetical protein